MPSFTNAMIESGRIPVYDKDMSIMSMDMVNPSFHNHPILRIPRRNGRPVSNG
jgi:hypothetical protein